jgi:hypothetical protein
MTSTEDYLDKREQGQSEEQSDIQQTPDEEDHIQTAGLPPSVVLELL